MFNQHFDASFNKSFSASSHSLKQLYSRRQSAPLFTTASRSYSPKAQLIKRQKNIDQHQSPNSTCLIKEFQSEIEAIDAQGEEQSGDGVTTFDNERRRAQRFEGTKTDELFLHGFSYDSEYELDATMSSDGKSDFHRTISSADFNTTGFSDSANFSASDSKILFEQSPPSWTDHWKRRYRQSKETAKLRRLSTMSEFNQHSVCSSNHTVINLMHGLPTGISRASVS